MTTNQTARRPQQRRAETRGRRPKGTGSVRRRGRVWEATITVRGERARETFGTSDEAEKWLDKQAGLLDKGLEKAVTGVPFSRLADEFREEKRADSNASPNHFIHIDGYIENHLLPFFGGKMVHQITFQDLNRYRANKLSGIAPVALDENGEPRAQRKLAPQTVIHHMNSLRGMFRLAQQLDWIEKNPMDFVKNPKLGRARPRPLDIEQGVLLQRVIPEADRGPTVVALNTGPRFGEVLGIRTFDVEFDTESLRIEGKLISRQDRTGKARMVWEPRSKAGRQASGYDPGIREIPISDTFAAYLRELIDRAEQLPDPENLELLFRTRAGTPMNPSNYRNRVYYPAISTVVIKLMSPGQFRRLIAAVPAEYQLATELLRLDELRLESVLKATWDDYDEEGRTLTFLDVDGEPRQVEISAELRERLAEHRATQEAGDRPNKFNYIFLGPGRRSAPIRFDSFSSAVFRQAFEDADLKEAFDRRFHRLRHTYASVMAGGVDMKTLQRFMGHARMSTTFDLYVHHYERANRPIGDTMDFYSSHVERSSGSSE